MFSPDKVILGPAASPETPRSTYDNNKYLSHHTQIYPFMFRIAKGRWAHTDEEIRSYTSELNAIATVTDITPAEMEAKAACVHGSARFDRITAEQDRILDAIGTGTSVPKDHGTQTNIEKAVASWSEPLQEWSMGASYQMQNDGSISGNGEEEQDTSNANAHPNSLASPQQEQKSLFDHTKQVQNDDLVKSPPRASYENGLPLSEAFELANKLSPIKSGKVAIHMKAHRTPGTSLPGTFEVSAPIWEDKVSEAAFGKGFIW